MLKNQVAHVKAERDVLASADDRWVVDLDFSFQDDENLYLVMEFCVGGDLMSLLMKEDILAEVQNMFFPALLPLVLSTGQLSLY